MAQIFISYRRSDSQANTDHIYVELVKAFGRKRIFKDVDDIPLGANFPSYLRDKLKSAKIVLVIIGKEWATVTSENGLLRLHDPRDFVRIEVEHALLAHDKGTTRLVPILVNNASMPSPEQLPSSIRSITELNAMPVRNDPDFENDSKRLVRRLKDMGVVRSLNVMPWVGIGLILMILVASLFASNLLNGAATSTPTNEATTEVALAATTAVPSSTEIVETSTLMGFQLVQTAEFGITQAYETLVTFNETVTQETALSANGTATAFQFSITETAAYGTLIALSVTPTFTSSATEKLTSTNTTLPSTPTNSPSPTSEFPTATITYTPSPIPDELAEALQLASTLMTSNSQWQELYPNGFIWEFNGVPMVLVPSGCFQMGNDPDGQYWNNEIFSLNVPDGGQQCFASPFWIDRTEVTQGDFARLGGEAVLESNFTGENRPVEQITWGEARDYCERIRGGNLPTEAQWEYAARGVDALFFPWGDNWNQYNAVWNRSSTIDVGSIPAGASWVKALDMSGNVFEWTSSVYADYPYDAQDGREFNNGQIADDMFLARGGSWYDTEVVHLRLSTRFRYYVEDTAPAIGFRCVVSYDAALNNPFNGPSTEGSLDNASCNPQYVATFGQIAIGQNVAVLAYLNDVNVRVEPNGTRIGIIDVYQGHSIRVDVVDGPVCDVNYRWWYIRTPTGLQGWVAEATEGGTILSSDN